MEDSDLTQDLVTGPDKVRAHQWTRYCHVVCISTDRVWIGDWIYWPLTTDFNTGTVNILTELHTPNITHKILSSPPDFQVNTLTTNSFLHNLPYRTELGQNLSLAYNISTWTTWKTQLFCCCARVCCCGNVFTEPLPRNGPGIFAHLVIVA
jgi:hypothetical protein